MPLAAVAVFVPWLISLGVKGFLNVRRDRTFSVQTSFSSGGMPSSHTTLVTAAATTVLLSTGLSLTFLVSLVVALIVIYDAMNTRRAIEEQLKAINLLLEGQGRDLRLNAHFGHDRFEVMAGLALGIAGPLAIFALFK